ncbi:hypothetical protein HK099_001794 [Clydaea vesicula]|uniref:FAD-binding domain-containing protein n=1 Tax=Clydaea vesicula TaxID=447962 RepID=A0AAD5XWZ6_9FUNG|nr:hypothetical protein HK099_001794 [Clydaea vesicula]
MKPRSMEILSSYEGVVEDISKRGIPVTHFTAVDDKTTLVSVNLSAGFHSKFDYGSLQEQWYVEECLTKFLTKKNVSVLRSTTLTNLVDCKTHVQIEISRGDVHSKNFWNETIVAKYVIAADGAKSRIRKLLNLQFPGEMLQNGYVAVHFKEKEDSLRTFSRNGMVLLFLKEGSAFITALPENSWIAAWDLTLEQEKPFLSSENDARGNPIQLKLRFDQYENQRAFGGECSLSFTDSWTRNEYRCIASKSVLLIILGIQDSMNIIWKLSQVILNKCSREILNSYEAERKHVGKAVVDLTTRVQNISAVRNPLLQNFRNFAFSFVTKNDFIIDTIGQTVGETIYSYKGLAEVSVEYFGKPPIFPYLLRRRAQNINRILSTRVRAGDRFRPDIVLGLSETFFSATAGFKILIFVGLKKYSFKPLSENECTEFCKEALEFSDGLVTDFFVVQSERELDHHRLGVLGQCLFLVRPDGYVGFRCEPLKKELLKGYLKKRIFSKRIETSSNFSFNNFDWLHAVFLSVLFCGIGIYIKRKFF